LSGIRSVLSVSRLEISAVPVIHQLSGFLLPFLRLEVNSDSIKPTQISCKLDTGLTNIITSIQKFGEVVIESRPCELTFVRKKDKQAQMMVADLYAIAVFNINCIISTGSCFIFTYLE
jgi:hypothetical protein